MAGKGKKKTTIGTIISVFNQKGGCGKTQTAMHVGAAFASKGYRTIIVDMDPQGTSLIWSSQASKDEPFPASVASLAVQEERLIGDVQKFAEAHDIVLIDCPPAIQSRVPWEALLISDLGLIPVIPLLDNVWASHAAQKLGLDAQKENPDLKLACVKTKMKRGRIYDESARQLDEKACVKVLNTMIWQRNAYPESQAFGTSVLGLDPKSEASMEINALTEEIIALLQIGGRRGKA